MDYVKGIVKWFNNKNGYGFVNIEGEDRDVFVHYSIIRGKGFKSLKEQQVVDVQYKEKDNRLFATDVIAYGRK